MSLHCWTPSSLWSFFLVSLTPHNLLKNWSIAWVFMTNKLSTVCLHPSQLYRKNMEIHRYTPIFTHTTSLLWKCEPPSDTGWVLGWLQQHCNVQIQGRWAGEFTEYVKASTHGCIWACIASYPFVPVLSSSQLPHHPLLHPLAVSHD